MRSGSDHEAEKFLRDQSGSDTGSTEVTRYTERVSHVLDSLDVPDFLQDVKS